MGKSKGKKGGAGAVPEEVRAEGHRAHCPRRRRRPFLFSSTACRRHECVHTCNNNRALQVQKEVDALRATAGEQYLKKDYAGALDAFSKAHALLPDGATMERSEMLQKKAFCLMNLKK